MITPSVPGGLAIVFDLDGTLIDSVPDVRAALNRMLIELGASPLSLKQVEATIGDGAAAMIERAFVMAGTSLDNIYLGTCLQSYLSHYRDHPVAHTTVYSGVREVLAAFKSQDVVMGICTNKPSAMAALVLEELDLDHYFAAVAAGDDTDFPKPDGRHIAQTLSLMGARGRQAIMVGDSETDMGAARDLGIPSIAVTYGYSKHGAKSLDADALIDAFTELPGAVSRLLEVGRH